MRLFCPGLIVVYDPRWFCNPAMQANVHRTGLVARRSRGNRLSFSHDSKSLAILQCRVQVIAPGCSFAPARAIDDVWSSGASVETGSADVSRPITPSPANLAGSERSNKRYFTLSSLGRLELSHPIMSV
jgi:hypothetical protein